ncbi:hypothetical protein [Vibrio phage pTD1]|uniref:Uncharacterized protein n=1 Tax=Vibrio phage pTD1 TaxID=1938577 RepID=A0A1Q2U2U4_9CAUD|nr:hypothetical protein FDH33_gp075 [Vibrio phage pTD1]BAW98284.1 hypothetical protein [Vibrio phage pTD1]
MTTTDNKENITMTKLTYVQRFATRFEKKIMKQMPELIKLYQRVANHDYYYDYCDAITGWRAGLESEQDILKQLDKNKEHEHHPILQTLWSNKGDKAAIKENNPFEAWLEKYHDASMEMYRFLEHLDRLEMTDEKLAHAIRAMRYVAKFLVEESKVEYHVHNHFPKLVYTKPLGDKSVGKKFVDKTSLPNKLQCNLNLLAVQVEMYDFDCLGELTPFLGTFDTVRFDPEVETEEHLAYINGYHFKTAYTVKGKLTSDIRRIYLRDLNTLTRVLANKQPVKDLYIASPQELS